jgi:hypothetical protein
MHSMDHHSMDHADWIARNVTVAEAGFLPGKGMTRVRGRCAVAVAVYTTPLRFSATVALVAEVNCGALFADAGVPPP